MSWRASAAQSSRCASNETQAIRAGTISSASVSSPLAGCSVPAMSCASTVLPAPFGPSTAHCSPGAALQSKPRRNNLPCRRTETSRKRSQGASAPVG